MTTDGAVTAGERSHLTFCRICESLCGLRVSTRDGVVTDVRPDGDHVATGGFACPKGLRQHHLYGSPDRLLRPRKRVGGDWRDVSWNEALGDIGSELARIRDEHGPDAIAMYVGTAAGFGVLHPVFAQGFMDGLGSRNMYSSATQDCANKFAVAERIYGFPFTQPFPDLLNTKLLVIVGANPMVSKWSFLQVPNPRRHLNAIRERGGRVVVVDPRRTETAKAAGEHVFIRPNSDLYFYLAFLHELIAAGGVREDRVDAHMNGFEEVRELVEPWTAERAAQHTGVSAEVLRQLVADYVAADGAALYSSTGVNMGAHGSLCFWIQEVINAVSGNLDARGGTLVGNGIFDFARFGKKYGLLVKDDRSRVGGFRKTNDAFPGGILADEILTPGPGQIRALIVTGGNPLLTMADSERLKQAFGELELLVTLDILPTETGAAAHYMLPCTSPLERPDLPFVFPLVLGMQARPYLQATNPVVDAPGEARDEATIYTELGTRAGAPLFGSPGFHRVMRALKFCNRALTGRDEVPQRLLLNLILKLSRQPSFRRLLGHGRLRPPNVGGDFLGARVYTDSARVELAPAELVSKLQATLASAREQGSASEFPFRLITKREVTTHNSWTHNYEGFLRGDQGRNYVFMNPTDAAALGLKPDDLADVRSSAGAIRLPVRTSDDLLAGVVAVPHGWGHQASGQRVAAGSLGVNVNILASSGAAHVDPFSGMSHLTGLPVDVRLAADDRLAGNWSGIARPPGGAD